MKSMLMEKLPTLMLLYTIPFGPYASRALEEGTMGSCQLYCHLSSGPLDITSMY